MAPWYRYRVTNKVLLICFSPVPEIINQVFVKTFPKRSFCMTENERFVIVFVKTGSINSGTGVKTLIRHYCTLLQNRDTSGGHQSLCYFLWSINLFMSIGSKQFSVRYLMDEKLSIIFGKLYSNIGLTTFFFSFLLSLDPGWKKM
jgi:hypothetical protein